jgi:tRNA (guanine-N7-)-methyltransferase
MGRRALPKINPLLDLSRHLVALESVACPWQPGTLFGVEQPLEVEIGSGKGLFLATAAGRHPDRNFLGIELGAKYARYAAARLARAGLENGRVICGDAVRVFRELLPADSLVAVHVYFPDPWWKKRHRKRRVLHAEMLRTIERSLLPGGRLHFWTDVEEYFRSTLQLVRVETGLLGPFDVAAADPAHDLDYRTHFERRSRLAGIAVYRAEFQRVSVAAAATREGTIGAAADGTGSVGGSEFGQASP